MNIAFSTDSYAHTVKLFIPSCRNSVLVVQTGVGRAAFFSKIAGGFEPNIRVSFYCRTLETALSRFIFDSFRTLFIHEHPVYFRKLKNAEVAANRELKPFKFNFTNSR